MPVKKEDYETSFENLKEKLTHLEKALDSDATYFNGNNPSLVDFAVAPLFVRAEALLIDKKISQSERYPKLTEWSESIMQLDAVRYSLPIDFDQKMVTYLSRTSPIAYQALFNKV